MALLRTLLGALVLVLACAGRASAENVVVVIDRGAVAKDRAQDDSALALRLVQRLQERGDKVRLYMVATKPDGKPRVTELKLEAAQVPELPGTFGGPTDVRAALGAALRGPTPKDPFVVVFVGPFGRVEPVPEGAGVALDAWNRTAPEGSRLIPLSLSADARKVLESAKGFRSTGAILFGVKDPKVEPEPWSAFDPDARLRAKITATIDVVTWGEGTFTAPHLTALGTEGDTFTVAAGGGLLLERPVASGTQTRVSLRAVGDGAWDLSPAPTLLFVGQDPKSEFRWLAPQGAHPHVEILDLERGVPRESRFRYQRSVGPALEHIKSVFAIEDPEAPIRTRAAGERIVSAHLAEGELIVVANYDGDAPLEARGEVDNSVAMDEFTVAFRLDWHVRSAPGRVRAQLLDHEAPRSLPPAATDPAWDLVVVSENRNAPSAVRLVWRAEPAASAAELVLRLGRDDQEESLWRAGEARTFRVDVPFKVRLLTSGDDSPSGATGTVILEALPMDGVELKVEGRAAWRSRQPRLLFKPEAVQYRIGAKQPEEERPLQLALDADGGDGAWLARLMESTPTVAVPGGSPQGFTVATLSPGRWEVRREGEWKGKRAGIFDDREERVPLTISWSGRAEPQVIEVPVVVPARWGRMGWVLVALAGGAVLLIVFTLASHRAEPITGTLLYTIQGVGGAVGRLPLAAVGRRRTAVVQDERGRLALGGEGTTLFHLKPTRVGGMAEVPTERGEVERRLLVDGLSFSVGRHALRYVQAGHEGSAAPPVAPTATPDLLGPEYDLPDPDLPRTWGIDPS